MIRAWVMVIRRRGKDTVEEAYAKILELKKDREWGERIIDIVTLLGHIDVCVVVGADDVDDLAEFVHKLRKDIRGSTLSTATLLAVDIDKRTRWPDRRRGETYCLMGIQCAPGKTQKAIAEIRRIREVLVADLVWGEFDILALVHCNAQHMRARSKVLREIAELDGIERTVTMIEDHG